MRVFISWSGERSKRVALLLKEWLSCVVQSSRPWVSSKDIDRGSLWFTEISQQLGETSVGIICLTQDNKEKPWILFEAGALAKGLNSARVCTLLIDLEPKDISDPLAQFNHTTVDKDGMHALLRTLNEAMGEHALDERVLDRTFETYWPQFNDEFGQILSATKGTPAKPRKSDDILGEILENTRSLTTRIRKLEDQTSSQAAQRKHVNRLAELASATIYKDHTIPPYNATDEIKAQYHEWLKRTLKERDDGGAA